MSGILKKTRAIRNFSIVFLLVIGFFLLIPENSEAQATPVTKGDTSASLTTDLIDETSDYDVLLSESSRLFDRKIYRRDVITLGNLPLAISYSGSSAPSSVTLLNSSTLDNLVNHSIRASVGDLSKLQSVDFYILQNVTFPVTKIVSGLVATECANGTAPNGTEIHTCFTNDTRVFAEAQDWKYEWKRLRDLTSITINKNQKTIINIEGKFKATTSGLSVDIVPSISVAGVSFSFPEYAWWNMSWANKKTVTVSSNLTSSLSGALYVLNLTKTVNHATNCQDLRIINSTEDTTRSIYVNNCNSTYPTYMWVNDSLGSGTSGQTRYHYYNNPNANNVSLNPSPFGSSFKLIYTFEGNVSNIVDTANTGTVSGIVINSSATQMMHGMSGDSSNGVGWVDLPNGIFRDPVTNPWSFAVWVMFYDNSTSTKFGMLEYDSAVIDGGVRLNHVAGELSGGCDNTGMTTVYTWTPITNKWYHIAFTRTGGDSGTGTLYIDGNQVAQRVQPQACTAGGGENRWQFARYQGGQIFKGKMDSVVFTWDVLSADQIMALANTTNIEGAGEELPETPFEEFKNIWNNNTQTIFINNSFRNLPLNITSLNTSNQGNFTQINTTDLKASRTIEALTFLENTVSLINKYLQLSGGTLTGTLVSQLIRPSADLTYDLGADAFRFRNVWAQFINATGNLTANNITANRIYENNNRFPQPITCSGTNKVRAFASDGTFTCAEDQITSTIVTTYCSGTQCTVSGMASSYNLTVWAKGVYTGNATPQNVTLYENTTVADQNAVDLQQAADRDSFALIYYVTRNNSNDVTYTVNNTGGTISNVKIMIQVAR